MVMAVGIKFYLTLLHILQNTTKFTDILLHGTFSANLSGILPYFNLTFFTLSVLTYSEFISDGIYYTSLLRILIDKWFHYIHFMMKDICIFPVY